jgi:hypothetical protein
MSNAKSGTYESGVFTNVGWLSKFQVWARLGKEYLLDIPFYRTFLKKPPHSSINVPLTINPNLKLQTPNFKLQYVFPFYTLKATPTSYSLKR